MLKTTRSSNRSAPSRNNTSKLAFCRNNNSRLTFRKNNSNGKVDGFDIGRNSIKHAKKTKNCLSHENQKTKKCLSLKIWPN